MAAANEKGVPSRVLAGNKAAASDTSGVHQGQEAVDLQELFLDVPNLETPAR